MRQSKKLGVVVAVDGTLSNVGMYEMSNDTEQIWDGDILTGPKIGAFLTINQNDVKIIASVVTEKVIDQQNTIKSDEFDNRYRKNSINRIIQLKTRGVITEGKFEVTSSFVPMIGNEITLTSEEELKIIYSVEEDEATINIGSSILENQPIQLSINKFFASHIGIFGNTGSGKSNTLHKLYLELFRSGFREKILLKSQFFVIDFNGEYTGDGMFGVDSDCKAIFNIDTRKKESQDKIVISKKYLFDADILSILFNATIATQVPFLRNAIKFYIDNKFDGSSFSKLVVGTYKKILTTGSSARAGAKIDWENIANKYIQDDSLFTELNQLTYYSTNHSYQVDQNTWVNENTVISDDILKRLLLIGGSQERISEKIAEVFEKSSEIQRLKMFLDFQKIFETTWNKFNIEHINPLFARIDSSIKSLEKIVTIKEDTNEGYKALNIFSLVHANQEITRLVPMLISKMFYDLQKSEVSGKKVTQTKHLIIDEAHNILNAEHRNVGDDWQDYRMSVFEEIIKEGRKFGFYLTLSSQRPADISPTILSQVHNYLIHRLVNEKDLRMLENTMPTLDKSSFQMIPSLGKGEVIITGNAMQVPVFVKIPKEEKIRPQSDDIDLMKLWRE